VSNFLAVATVTAAIERLLKATVEHDVSGAKVVLDRPDTKRIGPFVNVFLYQAVANAALSNADLPARRVDGSLSQRPRTVLDLHYLLTFHGDDGELEPQRLYGSVVRAFTARPVLTRALFSAVVTEAGKPDDPKHKSLVESDLADAEEVCRISPLPMDMEHMSRLWAEFPQAAYVLSSAWTVSPVVIETTDVPAPSAPVLRSTLTATQLRRPVIDRVEPAEKPLDPLTADVPWRIRGTQLLGDDTMVRVAGQPLVLTSANPFELNVDVAPAAGSLRAGRVALEVVHRALLGDPPDVRGEQATAVRAVSLCPRVVAAAGSASKVEVTTDVPVRRGQRINLRLLDASTGDVTQVLPMVVAATDATALTFPVPTGITGDHAIVVTVDAADSPLQRDPDSGAITGPIVTLP
jgi:hypothetical protein